MATRLGQEEGSLPTCPGPGPVWEELIHCATCWEPQFPSLGNWDSHPTGPKQLPVLPEYPVFLLGCLVLKEQSENPPTIKGRQCWPL